MTLGMVSLVGAGPGDPGLLTRAALARLRRADLVLYDALVSDEILRLARKARRFSVGKRAGRPSMAQATIHTLMIRAARRGQRVVRLKGGDPFVFGRGGEEALALRAADVPFEIVPGVTSAIAAPALAGIPVTHRGAASAFAVIAAHAPESYVENINAIVPGAITLVFLMAVAEQRGVAAALVARGWSPSTPAAILLAASCDNAEAWTGTLADLSRGDGVFDQERPGTIVVGDVVHVRAQLEFRLAAATTTLETVKARR